MAAPKGSYTPKSGPLAGQTFALRAGDAPTAPYTRYQAARSAAVYGFTSYQAERGARSASRNEHMHRVVEAVAEANGKTKQQAMHEYLLMRQENGGKQPKRNQVRNRLVNDGLIDANDEIDWGAGSP